MVALFERPLSSLLPKSPVHRDGFVGALARFNRRSYAIDYIALACLTALWTLVRHSVRPNKVGSKYAKL